MASGAQSQATFVSLASREMFRDQFNKKNQCEEISPEFIEDEILIEFGSTAKDDESTVNETDLSRSGKDAEPAESSEAPKLKGTIRLGAAELPERVTHTLSSKTSLQQDKKRLNR